MNGPIGRLENVALDRFPEEVRNTIWHATDQKTRVAIALSSKQLNQEAGARSSAGIDHGLDTLQAAAQKKTAHSTLYTIHENILNILPHNEDIQSHRAQRWQNITREHLPQLFEHVLQTQHHHQQALNWQWQKLPISATTSTQRFTAFSLLETRLLRFFNNQRDGFDPRTDNNAQLASAQAAHASLHPMLYRMLSFECPADLRETLADKASALPDGLGAHTLQELAFANTTEELETRLREMARTSAIALHNGAGCEILQNLLSSERDINKRSQLRLDVRDAALAKPNGEGGAALLDLLRSSVQATETNQLLTATHEYAINTNAAAASEILENLLPFAHDENHLKTLRAETLQHAVRLAPELQIPIISRLAYFAYDPEERTNLRIAAIATHHEDNVQILVRLAATCTNRKERSALSDVAQTLHNGAQILFTLSRSLSTPIVDRSNLRELTRISAANQPAGKGIPLLEKLRPLAANSTEQALIRKSIYQASIALSHGQGVYPLYRLLQHATTSAECDLVFGATMYAAAHKPHGDGFAILCPLSSKAPTAQLLMDVRSLAHKAAFAQPLVVRAHSLYVLSKTALSLTEQSQLREESRQAALLAKHGTAAKTLYRLAFSAQSPMERVQLFVEARNAAIEMPRHLRNVVLQDLLRMAPTTELRNQTRALLFRSLNPLATTNATESHFVTAA